MVNIQVSIGELIDKLSILQVKLNNITNEDKLKLVTYEFALLYNESIPYFSNKDINDLYQLLVEVNSNLWRVEDKLRILEAEKRFDDEFIKLAREVYYLNDIRFTYKNSINSLLNSEIKEVKEYVKYN